LAYWASCYNTQTRGRMLNKSTSSWSIVLKFDVVSVEEGNLRNRSGSTFRTYHPARELLTGCRIYLATD
jgi:hypothetical protein